MTRVEKLAIANWAIKTFPPILHASGKHIPATATQPECWRIETGEWRINLAEHVLLAEADPALSSLLDIWAVTGGKVLSASWMPDQPWVPTRVVQCKPGCWQQIESFEQLHPDPAP